MANKNKKYKEMLFDELQDANFAAGYLTECYKLGQKELLLGLKDVIEARGGISKISKKSKLNRESLYKLLSKTGNPKLKSLEILFDALGLEIVFAARDGEKQAA